MKTSLRFSTVYKFAQSDRYPPGLSRVMHQYCLSLASVYNLCGGNWNDELNILFFPFSLEICTPKCDENSYCENGKCLCRRGLSLGLDYTCQASEGETSTDMRFDIRGLSMRGRNIAVKIVEHYQNHECKRKRTK